MPEKEPFDRAECRFGAMRVKHSRCTTVLSGSLFEILSHAAARRENMPPCVW